MNTTEMKTESVEQKAWYENYQEKEYEGVKYNMYACTPEGVEQKIKAFIDVILRHSFYQMNLEDCEVITEGSSAVLFDVWFFKASLISNIDIIPQEKPNFMIARRKHNEKKKYGYRIRYGL